MKPFHSQEIYTPPMGIRHCGTRANQDKKRFSDKLKNPCSLDMDPREIFRPGRTGHLGLPFFSQKSLANISGNVLPDLPRSNTGILAGSYCIFTVALNQAYLHMGCQWEA